MGMKALVADNDQRSRENLAVLLANEGYEVIEADSGDRALNILGSSAGSRLLILKLTLEGREIAEICQKIRGLSKGGYTYIILVANRSSWNGLISGFEDDFVLEPVDPQELKARLQIGTRVLSLHNTLMERSEMLNEFAYTIGHDIKTTVVAMTMTSEEALEGAFGQLSDAYTSMLQSCRRSLLDTRQLVDTLVLLGKFEIGKRRAGKDSLNVRSLACDVMENLAVLGEPKALRLLVAGGEQGAEMIGSAQEFEQLLTIMIGNAIKLSPHGGSVTVSIGRRDSMLSIEIPDTGSGIGADEASKIFTPLALSSARRRYAGFGLGMYLCRLIVESHNGTIRYDSRPNGGNFVCEFSLAQQA